MPPHHPGPSLGPGGAVSAPKGSLRAGSPFFAGLLQSFVFFIRKALGSSRPVNLSLLCARYIILKEVYLHIPLHPNPDSFFGSWRSAQFTDSRLIALVSPQLSRSSRGSCSGSEFSPQSWIRLWPYLHDWLIQMSSRE